MRAAGPLLIFALLIGGCRGPSPIPPGGIVSNNPCIDAVLEQIAAPGQISAVSIYSHDARSASASLPWARQFPAAGISAEELIAARPRLLLTGNLAHGGTNAALRHAGIRLHGFGVPATIAESRAQVMAIARIIGRTEQGKILAAKIDAAAAPAATAASAHKKSAIIWQSGGFVPGRGTLQDEYLARAGFMNASALYGLDQWGILPLETLIRNPPDVIFMPVKEHGDAEGNSGREAAMRQRLLRHMPKTRIVAFPDRLLFCSGPTIIKAMAAIRGATM